VSQLLVIFFLSFNIGSMYFVTAVLNMDSYAGQATEVLTIKIFSCVFTIIIIKLISLSLFNQDRQPTSTRCP